MYTTALRWRRGRRVMYWGDLAEGSQVCNGFLRQSGRLPQSLHFEALLRCFLLISGASWFLRHELLPLLFLSPWSYEQEHRPAHLKAEPTLIMSRQT